MSLSKVNRSIGNIPMIGYKVFDIINLDVMDLKALKKMDLILKSGQSIEPSIIYMSQLHKACIGGSVLLNSIYYPQPNYYQLDKVYISAGGKVKAYNGQSYPNGFHIFTKLNEIFCVNDFAQNDLPKVICPITHMNPLCTGITEGTEVSTIETVISSHMLIGNPLFLILNNFINADYASMYIIK